MQLVLGKFFASMLLYMTMLLLTCLYFTVLFRYGNPDFLPLIPGMIAVAVTFVLWFAADERQYQTIIRLVNAQAGWLQTEASPPFWTMAPGKASKSRC